MVSCSFVDLLDTVVSKEPAICTSYAHQYHRRHKKEISRSLCHPWVEDEPSGGGTN